MKIGKEGSAMEKTKILVVEDEWIVANQICTNLAKSGYKAFKPAASGEEALKAIAAKRPDLVIMDIMLGGELDGIETADRIVSQFDIPVIFLTSYSNPGLIERASTTGSCCYLIKPFDNTTLRSNIEMALHKHRSEKPLKVRYENLKNYVKECVDTVARDL